MDDPRRIDPGAGGRSARRPSRGTRLLVLGLALSLPVHAAAVAWMALTLVERPGVPAGVAVPIELAALPPDGDDALPPSGAAPAPGDPDGGGDSPGPAAAVPAPGPGALDASLGAGEAAGTDGLGTSVAGGDGLGIGGGGAGGSGGFGGGAGGTSFFGVGGRGSRFAFIVDKSGSMTGSRLAAAKDELAQAVAGLPDFATVFVSFYDSGPPTTFSDRWERVRPATVKRMNAWLRQVSASGDTQPLQSFRQAFALEPRPDVIFFLTDGAIPVECPEQVRALNSRGKRVQVNSIAFGDGRGNAQLRQISQESGGQFREVPSEPGEARGRAGRRGGAP